MMTTHKGTIPALPKLGQALSRLGLEVQVPKLTPGRNDGHKGFIQDATVLSTFLDIVSQA